ncbi:MAG: autotransporter outer membrane beta-barrel domain-containing protein [Cyclobacteriaceae bacterium]|nr:autotransporter outer membrane beta-barrel domain-containing protein [Cyclobacteriaceae bacterium]MDH4295940.1 autotransporter outer membrane beta-barrel domain-containing protein [Cyclobacteriaceae bacterium]MDH5249281.1 autotransporter outer membrane beta-barrel domain-containing protein [Cyclobacteriaceae bacterium]
MKKIAMLFTALCVTTGAFAQFEKGRMLVGGSLEADFTTERSKFDGNSNRTGKYSEFSLDPQFGIFIIDNLAVGGAIGLSTYTYKEDDSDYKYVSNELTIEPMARYYLPQGIFFQGMFILGSSSDKSTNNGNTNKDKYAVSGFALSAGYAYFLMDNVTVEPQLGYRSKGYKDKSNDVKDVDAGLFIRIGFQIYFRNKGA